MNTKLSDIKLFLTLFFALLFVSNISVASDINDKTEVRIFHIIFDQDTNKGFNDILLIKTEGFIKYQWEPEGLYIIMEKTATEQKLNEVLKQLNFKGTFKISGSKNRMLPTKYLRQN